MRTAPELGEHTAVVLEELGLSVANIDQLRERGVV
jgi:crotonobetainyl-CoA:carnitine CoA-transferase CaiB-like acyl-CoA transferase